MRIANRMRALKRRCGTKKRAVRASYTANAIREGDIVLAKIASGNNALQRGGNITARRDKPKFWLLSQPHGHTLQIRARFLQLDTLPARFVVVVMCERGSN